MFEIRELEWEYNNDGVYKAEWTCNQKSVGIEYKIIDTIYKIELGVYWGDVLIHLDFAKTIDEAKQKANEHWRGILKEFLREV